MPNGKIASVVSDKGFGFIGPADGGPDLFFHFSAIGVPLEQLAVGQEVSYEVDSAAEKPRARSVAIVGELQKPKPSARGGRQDSRGQRGRDDRRGGGRSGERGGPGKRNQFDRGRERNSGDRGKRTGDSRGNWGRGGPDRGGQDRGDRRDQGPRERTPQGPPIEVENGIAGTIASVRSEKGFGFITPDDGTTDVFFHHSSISQHLESLVPGQTVEFELDTESEKPRAKKVALRGEILRSPPGGFERKTRPPRHQIELGYVTKLLRKTRQGFISPDAGGAEVLFDQSDVSGDKMYVAMQVGDYVEFARTGESVRTKFEDAPKVTSVRVVEKEIKKIPMKELPNNPKARRKKPTWRR